MLHVNGIELSVMAESQSEFLDQIEGYVRQLIVEAREDLAMQPLPVLQRRPDEKRWNALECIAHLNAYNEMYLSKFEQAVHKAKAQKKNPAATAKIGWLGRFTARSVDPERRTKSKMSAPKKTNFIYADLQPDEVKKFVTYQEILLRVIAKSREVDINYPKVAIQAFPLLKMNLAEFLQFFIFHQRRHMLQAQEAAMVTVVS
jgi:uncharacterized damage-inducible protein DinB